ncbi:MAG: S9 family peptidase [Chitinophagales bacterium]|nr:S9 family peptidase [Chitinophagales bacterium]
MRILLLPILLLLNLSLFAQQKKALDHADIHRWRRIEQTRLSNDGRWVAYVHQPVTEGDSRLELWDARSGETRSYERSLEPRFSADGQWLAFRIKAPLDTLKAQRRRKVKDDDLPKDTFALLNLRTFALEKTARLKSFNMPEKWTGAVAWQCEPGKDTPAKKDTSAVKKPVSKLKPKKEDKENGSRLFVRNLRSGVTDTFGYVQQYVFAEKAPRLLFSSAGKGDTLTFAIHPAARNNGVYWYDLEKGNIQPLWRAKKGKYQQLALDQQGNKASFLADLDTTKARIRPWQLAYWSAEGKDSARIIAAPGAAFLPSQWGISENGSVSFSEDGSKLFFGAAPPPVLNDTTLLSEEIVNVEVWAWQQNRLYTQQEIRMEADKKRNYTQVWHIRENKFVPLATPEIPELRLQNERNANLALSFTEEPYAQQIQYQGAANKDIYALNLLNGTRKLILSNKRCNPRLSPDARYIAWWSEPDSAWYAWNATSSLSARLTSNNSVKFYNEEEDVPDYPSEYGLAGWLENDAALLVYDRFDIWRVDPDGKKAPQRLTRGRETQTSYRYLRLDPEERFIKADARLLLHQFSEGNKHEGYAWLDLKSGTLMPWLNGAAAYSRQPQKAKDARLLVFTYENFETFPDLQAIEIPTGTTKTTDNPNLIRQISKLNPQQAEYRWGSIEPMKWTSSTGEVLEGLLVKPEGFDPNRQYPMLVNFYERMSDDLFRHNMPNFGRSSINWTFYASRGYVIFIPDIPYRIGYPGESAYNAIMSGVTSLLDRGFIDPKRVGLQGHSWGGYQTAYLVTRTDLFACAEAGAPVANMTSAYGGIRYESGLSRSFQYEHQQSRIGGTLWEYPSRYIENSPLFSLDKVNTPVLILHNDKDGAVPWTQGIELYNGLLRLNKPVWLLNYNDEPHWPVKLQNRIDFQTRMAQFFDYYLQGAPMPRWMKRGVPPIEKGILQGLEQRDE